MSKVLLPAGGMCLVPMLAAALAFLPCGEGRAAEGAVFGGPTGGTDIRTALTPPAPGFYGSIVGLYVLGNGSSGDTGAKVALHVNTNLGVLAGGLLYAYPFRVFGGSLDSFVQQAYSYGYAEIGKAQGTAAGANDLFVEFAGWSRHVGPLFGGSANPLHLDHPLIPYGLTVKLAYSMILPTGAYSRTDILPQGHNDLFVIPNLAATYITQPNAIGQGIELDAHFFADFASTNPTTHYHTGTVIDIDYAATDRLGRFQLGLAGFYAQQVQRDVEAGAVVAPNGKRLVLVDAGPVVAYDFPHQQGTLKIKYQVPLLVHDSLNVQRVVLSYSFRF